MATPGQLNRTKRRQGKSRVKPHHQHELKMLLLLNRTSFDRVCQQLGISKLKQARTACIRGATKGEAGEMRARIINHLKRSLKRRVDQGAL